MPTALFEWLENTRVALAIGRSLRLTEFLSGIHLLGQTLLLGSAAIAALRLLGASLRGRPLAEITRTAGHGILVGLAVVLASGLLLFLPRASSVAANSAFQFKMGLLAAAGVFHFTLYRSFTNRQFPVSLTFRFACALGPALWFAVGVAGAVFILFE